MNIVAEKVYFFLYPIETGSETLLTQYFLSFGEKKRRPRKRKEGRFLSSAGLQSVRKSPSCEQVKGVEIYAKINTTLGSCAGRTDKAVGTGFKMFHPKYPVSPKRTCSRRKCEVKNSVRLDR